MHFFSRSYKDLMVQCNHLGRSETRAKQKIEKASELIKKLRVCSSQPKICS
jgi:TRAF-interacting protein